MEPDNRFYLEVPYEQKDEAKMLGARFDGRKRKWFVLELEVDVENFSKWSPRKEKERVDSWTYLKVQEHHREAVLQLGAKYDPVTRLFYDETKGENLALTRWHEDFDCLHVPEAQRRYLSCNKTMHDFCRKSGAIFDPIHKKFYDPTIYNTLLDPYVIESKKDHQLNAKSLKKTALLSEEMKLPSKKKI